MSLKAACWPDPVGMVEELRGLGIETMITAWPFMSADSVHRPAFEAAGALAVNVSSGRADTFWEYLQQGALITPLSEATRNLTIEAWVRGYGSLGVRAVWLDETEPDRTAESDAALRSGGWSYEGTNALVRGPVWRQQWIRTMTDALRGLWGTGNFFALSRSAWLGTAKYGHAVWSGDTDSSWAGLAAQIPTGLGAGLSGIGLWVSVFRCVYAICVLRRFSARCLDTPWTRRTIRRRLTSVATTRQWTHSTRRLRNYLYDGHSLQGAQSIRVLLARNMVISMSLLRWRCLPIRTAQLAPSDPANAIARSVSPLMRLHGHRRGGPPSDPVCMQTNGDNEPWTLFKNETRYNAFIEAIRWREQARNYVVSLQAEWSASGMPMIAPVWLHFPADPVCAFTTRGDDGTCAGAFMFGTDWLAKPVTRLGQSSAWVYLPALPAGQSWEYAFGTRTNYGAGPVNVTVATPIDEFPLFYRNNA